MSITKGKWEVKKTVTGNIRITTESWDIAEIFGNCGYDGSNLNEDENTDEAIANAALIAAAPETKRQRDNLLEAMKKIMSGLHGSPTGYKSFQIAKQAIAQASK